MRNYCHDSWIAAVTLGFEIAEPLAGFVRKSSPVSLNPIRRILNPKFPPPRAHPTRMHLREGQVVATTAHANVNRLLWEPRVLSGEDLWHSKSVVRPVRSDGAAGECQLNLQIVTG